MAKKISHMDLLMAISSLTDENQLNQISAAVKNRKDSLSQIRLTTIKVGDTVKFANIRPTYLAGLTAKVVDVKRKTVVVSMPQNPQYGRFAGLPRVRVPISLIA